MRLLLSMLAWPDGATQQTREIDGERVIGRDGTHDMHDGDQIRIGARVTEGRVQPQAALGGAPQAGTPAPRHLPFLADATWFEPGRGSPHRAQMQNASAFGIHVSSAFPNLQVQLWSVRR